MAAINSIFHIVEICPCDYGILHQFYLVTNELATCWVVQIFHPAWHEKRRYFFQIKCPVEMFPQRLSPSASDCYWWIQKTLVSNYTQRLVGIKLAFVSLDWKDQVDLNRSAAKKTDNWKPIKTEREGGMGGSPGRGVDGFVPDNEFFNWHRSADLSGGWAVTGVAKMSTYLQKHKTGPFTGRCIFSKFLVFSFVILHVLHPGESLPPTCQTWVVVV